MITPGFIGTAVNPIIDARLEKGLSAQALAKRTGLSKQYVSRVERGTYTSISPGLLKWVSQALEVTPSTVEALYHRFQEVTRARTLESTQPTKLVRTPTDDRPGGLVFESWRAGWWPSTNSFSEAFCVHPEMVRKYEELITPEMPRQIKAILVGAGLLEEPWEEKFVKQRITSTRIKT